jgi:predicted  nucleic acid-binding Zn-ribbon protein
MEERPMKPNLLRTPLINSAIFLGVVSLVVYFTLTSPGGTVWSALGAIFYLVIHTIQLLIALALGILVCLCVLIGIFLGATAMFDAASASRMYEGLRQTILNWLAPLVGLFKSADHKENLQSELSELGVNLKTDFQQLVNSTRQELTSAQGTLAGKVQALHGKLQAVADAADGKASAQQLEEITAEISTLTETLAATDANVKALQGKIEEAVKKAGEVDADKILGDVPARLETLEQQEAPESVDLTPLEKKIAALQDEIDNLKSTLEKTRNAQPASAPEAAEVTVSAEPAAAEVEVEEKNAEEPEHRLLAYFDDKADQDKLTALVAETVKKDMTYAQVTDFLIKKMGKQGAVISEHPSLAKDYIRQCRRNAS